MLLRAAPALAQGAETAGRGGTFVARADTPLVRQRRRLLASAVAGPGVCPPAAGPHRRADLWYNVTVTLRRLWPTLLLIAGCDNPRYSPLVPVLDKSAMVRVGRDGLPACKDGLVDASGTTYLCDQPAVTRPLAPFGLDRTEVTVAQYRACVAAGACPDPSGNRLSVMLVAGRCNYAEPERDRHPMNCIDQAQAAAYCAWLGRALPTEEEWEYAAGPLAYPWGSATPDATRACFGAMDTCLVDQRPRTLRGAEDPAGLADLAGDVWEWTRSAACPYDKPECMNGNVVLRGGSWDYGDPFSQRSTTRIAVPSDWVAVSVGLRCAGR